MVNFGQHVLISPEKKGNKKRICKSNLGSCLVQSSHYLSWCLQEAMKIRKLLPASPTNQTTVCPDLCDPCPDGCYPYPDKYGLPPPLAPPPPPLEPHISSKHGGNISPYVIVIATLLGVAFLIVSYYLVIVKNCAGLNPFRPRRNRHEDTEDEENHGPVIDHPIWYIRTVGLQPSVINSIAVFRYKKGDSLIEGTDCSICLNEFQDDEILRLLPKCDHAFHIPCIDTWLRSHTNCPVCRAGVISNVRTTPVAPDSLNNNSSSPNGDNQVRDTERMSDRGSSSSQARNTEVEENQITANEGVESTQANLEENAASLVTDDSDENKMVQEEIQQMRRSISADSAVVSKIRLSMVNLPIAESGEGHANGSGDAHKCEPAENSSTAKSKTATINDHGPNTSSHMGPVSMKRSLSCGGRSFFSLHSRSVNAVLPL